MEGDDDIFGGAENLEDGELWLPSDFFAVDDNVQLSSNSTKSKISSYCSSSSRPAVAADCMVDSQPLPAFQRLKPAARCGSAAAAAASSGGYDNCNCKTGSGWTGVSPVHRSSHLNPVHTQVETFIEQRAWTALQQRTRLALNRVVLPPSRTSGHGGTGVFLPRVSSNMHIATKDHNHNHHQGGSRKGQRTANKHEIKHSPRKIMLNQRQDERCSYVTAAWVGLPNHRYYRM